MTWPLIGGLIHEKGDCDEEDGSSDVHGGVSRHGFSDGFGAAGLG
jgi:hypothetical protein